MAVDIGFPSTSASKMQGPAYVRPEMVDMFKVYSRIRDALSGEDAVKRQRMKYLPKPNPEDTSPENSKRYQSYLDRAVFYPATGRTMQGFVGQIFMRDPTFKLPAQLDGMETDASGDGQSLEQVARTCTEYVLAYGRAGLLADYPNTNGEGVTQAEVDDGDATPMLRLYAPWHVPNWRTGVNSKGKEALTLVVIREGYEVDDDGFERKFSPQIRELRMVNNECVATIWQQNQGASLVSATAGAAAGMSLAGGGFGGNWNIIEGPYVYKDANGEALDYIPFTFVGSVNNNASVDAAPFDGLAALNLAHYRNSADYEESAFLCGQPTVVLAGLTQDWVKDVLGGRVVFGSRAAIPLPAGGMATMLQAEANTLVKEAMDGKERQMVALGAKLVQQAEVQRTATETDIESTAENSVLSAVAKNVKAAIEFCLKTCAAFAIRGVGDDAIEFDLSTEFDLAKLDPSERAQLIKEWQSGAIAFEEMREGLRKAGIASLDDKTAATKIAQETADAAAAAMALATQNDATPGGGTPPKGLPGKPGATPPAPAPGAPPKPAPAK